MKIKIVINILDKKYVFIILANHLELPSSLESMKYYIDVLLRPTKICPHSYQDFV